MSRGIVGKELFQLYDYEPGDGLPECATIDVHTNINGTNYDYLIIYTNEKKNTIYKQYIKTFEGDLHNTPEITPREEILNSNGVGMGLINDTNSIKTFRDLELTLLMINL